MNGTYRIEHLDTETVRLTLLDEGSADRPIAPDLDGFPDTRGMAAPQLVKMLREAITNCAQEKTENRRMKEVLESAKPVLCHTSQLIQGFKADPTLAPGEWSEFDENTYQAVMDLHRRVHEVKPDHGMKRPPSANPWPECPECKGRMMHTLAESFCADCGFSSENGEAVAPGGGSSN